MGISLTGLTPAATYVSLVKFGDNNAVTTSLKALSDGAGNDLPLQLSTTSVLLNGLQNLQGTTASDVAVIGSELLTTGTSDASWTGTDFATGYTHVAGSTTTLTSAVAAVAGNNYMIYVSMTLRTTGTISISFGGATFSSCSGNIPNVGFTASSTASLVITPTSDFNGKIVVSIKDLTKASAITTWKNSSGSVVNELRSNVGGVFLGINAGINTQGGSTSVGIGNYAMQGNVNGIGNTAVGHNALGTNGGYKNVAIGRNAFAANLSGEYSTAVGGDALGNNRNGTGNTAIGQNALNANTTGSQNIALGTYAGSQYSNSNSNIIIGYNAQAGANDTTNQIIIGLVASGLGSNKTTIGSGSTTQTYLAGNLTLGTTTDAGAKFYVKGSGTTSATTSLLVQNSSNTDLARLTDDGVFKVGNVTMSGQRFASTIGDLEFNLLGGYSMRFLSAGAEIARYSWNGNWNFGTAYTPDAKINIRTSGTSSATKAFLVENSYVAKMFCINDAGQVSLQTVTPHASALFQIDSTGQGMLPPRMTTAQKTAITSPAAGLMVYDSSLNQMSYYNGTTWINF